MKTGSAGFRLKVGEFKVKRAGLWWRLSGRRTEESVREVMFFDLL
ncbi:hypothetical protein CDAR_1331, partial [Caerostris darwini]